MHLIRLLAESPPAGSSVSLVPLYYVLSILALLSGLVYGSIKFWGRTKKQWVDEGETRRRQAEAMESNTKAATLNTTAIEKLSTEMRTFRGEIRESVDKLDERITRLEGIDRHRA